MARRPVATPSSPRVGSSRPVPEVLELAADGAILAPSVHNTQPWRIVLHADRLDLRADRTRQLTTVLEWARRPAVALAP